MNKTTIECVRNPDGTPGFTSNPVRGECPVNCPYCYVKPFRAHYGWHKDIRFYPQELEAIRKRKKPTGIFVGSTIELFHDKTIQYMPEIIETVRNCPQHTFMFLTKQPQNLAKFSPFPENAWVGVSVTGKEGAGFAYPLTQLKATIKFLSIEPLLAPVKIGNNGFTNSLENAGINLVIIGQQTPVKPTIMPKIEWVKDIVEACDKAGVKVFLKDSLRDLLIPDALMDDIFWESDKAKLRQEFPVE